MSFNIELAPENFCNSNFTDCILDKLIVCIFHSFSSFQAFAINVNILFQNFLSSSVFIESSSFGSICMSQIAFINSHLYFHTHSRFNFLKKS
ncbi:MAG: hypothetical protein Q8S84_00030 [bacterium]|nr:hypothetical protein [bacterium]MDP3379988.1 hypothetical protein [bacterium]